MTEAEEAARHWGGTGLRLLRNRENAVYEMRLPDGRRAALRLHRMGYQGEAEIRSELWWCASLAARGVAVPAPIPAADGALLLRLHTGRHASAIAWMEGDALGEAGVPLPGSRAEQLERHHALGALVAQVHGVTDNLTLPADFTRPHWGLEGLVGEAPFWGRFWEHPGLTAPDAEVLRQARAYLHEELVAHQEAGARLGPIHADVLRENVLVNGRSLSLIDFDDSGIGFRLYDLGTVLSQNLYEPAYAEIRDALMEGYGTTDRHMVEVFTLARTCASVGWTAPRLAPDDPIHVSHIARAVMWARHLMG